MNVVVGGATGFIGQQVVKALVQRGDKVVVLALDAARAHSIFGSQVEVVAWHPPQMDRWMERVDGMDAVINLSGAPIAPTSPQGVMTQRWSEERKGVIRSSRIEPTRALVEAIAHTTSRPRVFINGSACGFYGSRGDEILTEDSGPGNDFLANVCIDWEAAAQPAEELGVRIVLLRTAVVLGPGGALPMMALPFRLFGGGTMGRPDQWVSWIHIQDEVNLILYTLQHDQLRGPVNASAPNPVTMKDFSQQIGSAVHRPSWVPFIDKLLPVVLGEASQFLLTSERVVPRAAEAAGYRFHYTQSAHALSDALGSR